MKKPKLNRLTGLTITVIICLLLAAVAGRQGANDRQSQTELLLLLQQVNQGTALVTAEARGLQRDSQALAAMQQANDHNIAAFQLLMEGSVKRNLPALAEFTGETDSRTRPLFDRFQTQVSGLIQSRTLLEQMLRSRDSLEQSADRLASQAESLADGLEQQQPTLDHLRAAYRIQSTLQAHAQAVRQAYADGNGAPALPLDSLRTDLKSLSTDGSAPTSPAIRRTAANLLNQIETHEQALSALDQYNTANVELRKTLKELQIQARELQQQLESVSGHVYDYLPWSIYVAMAFMALSLGLCCGLGYLLGKRVEVSIAVDTSALAPASQGERTSPTFISQLKTEKNLLMNDIKPIGEGILYIKADEHLEATGDLARCLNQSREALARRIDQLKRQVGELQTALSDIGISKEDHTPASKSERHDQALLIDLTFKGHAELDGLQRHLRNQTALDKEECKQLLVRCLRAERVLDEIRVRLKKSEHPKTDDAIGSTFQAQGLSSPHQTKVSALVSKLAENLDELHTQPEKTRRSRIIPA